MLTGKRTLNLLLLPIILNWMGCSSPVGKVIYKRGEAGTDRKASAMTKQGIAVKAEDGKTKVGDRGLIVGAVLYTDPDFSMKYFGIDLISLQVIPVLVALENPANNNSFVIDPRKATLKLADAEGTVLTPVRIKDLGYPEQEKELESRLLSSPFSPEFRLLAGEHKNGFILFDARQWEKFNLDTLEKDLGRAILQLPVRKEPLKIKKGQKINPGDQRYIGENLIYKILFD
ncbi:MAG: hypothetical protein D6805_10255 [Planctomycetota bacterium]|nr:MAG: hypothetical protein D6805_10255 [Planctomycetota bacterium]